MAEKWQWLAVPFLIIVALIAVLILNQPKVNAAGTDTYVDVNGDEYQNLDYISPDEIGIGDLVVDPSYPSDYLVPQSMKDCDSADNTGKDFCYENYAVLTGDEKGCEAAVEQGVKDDCFARLAQQKNDRSLCDNIVTGKPDCYADVAIATNDTSLCDKTDYEAEQCVRAAEAMDFSLCPDGQNRRICNDAVSEGKPEYCTTTRIVEDTCWNSIDNEYFACQEELKIESPKAFCYYNIALNTNSASLCNKAGPNMNLCFFKIATTLNNPAICENLAETRDNCVAWVAFNTRNKQLCYQAGSEAQSCIEDIEQS